MMKRPSLILLVMLTTVLFLAIPACAGGAGEKITSGEYTYRLQADGTAELVRYKGSQAKLSIPDALDGIPLTVIGEEAFDGCSDLLIVTVPAGVTAIGDYAFYGCSGLAEIILPAGLAAIGDEAFYGCTGLAEIILPDTVAEVGVNPFSMCLSLRSIVVSPEHPYLAVTDDALIYLPDGTLVCYYNQETSGAYQVPAGVLRIGDYAFAANANLNGIILPEGLTAIGYGAFFSGANLRSVSLPDSVTEIGEKAFYNCTLVSEIAIPPSVTEIGKNAFSKQFTFRLIVYAGSYGEQYAVDNNLKYAYAGKD